MGRKKGKQSGSFGSKKVRFQAERIMRLDVTNEQTSRHSGRQQQQQRWPIVAVPPRTMHRQRHHKDEESTPSLCVVDGNSTLLEACAITIGKCFELLVADPETVAFFEALPGKAIELISRNCSRVTEKNVDLLVTNTQVERLYLRGDVGDDELASMFPRRRRETRVGRDEWTVRDVSKDLRGCVALRDLFLDAPVTTGFFMELCQALPDLERLELGSRCWSPPDAVQILLSDHPNLKTLDVTNCDWLFLNDVLGLKPNLPSGSSWDADDDAAASIRRRRKRHDPINLIVCSSSYDLLVDKEHQYYRHPLRPITLSRKEEPSSSSALNPQKKDDET